jgi:hypothetical protein
MTACFVANITRTRRSWTGNTRLITESTHHASIIRRTVNPPILYILTYEHMHALGRSVEIGEGQGSTPAQPQFRSPRTIPPLVLLLCLPLAPPIIALFVTCKRICSVKRLDWCCEPCWNPGLSRNVPAASRGCVLNRPVHSLSRSGPTSREAALHNFREAAPHNLARSGPSSTCRRSGPDPVQPSAGAGPLSYIASPASHLRAGPTAFLLAADPKCAQYMTAPSRRHS